MKTKDEIHPELKQFFEKAKKKGWKKGQHLFNFLDETDMMRYDNIKEKLVREEERNRIKKEIENSPRIITEHELQNMKTIELSYDGRLIPVEEVLKILEGEE